MTTTTPASWPTITVANEGDVFLVVRRSGDYIGEVYFTSTLNDPFEDGPAASYTWHGSAIVINADGEREMIVLDATFPSHFDAIEAVAKVAA
jgi:hypothetical protein